VISAYQKCVAERSSAPKANPPYMIELRELGMGRIIHSTGHHGLGESKSRTLA